MDTTATNKRIREIVQDIEHKRLIPNPDFQRRLVWSQHHKAEFIKTIRDGLPFPEIYIAAGEVDVDSARGHSMLVDGQQRVSTIFEYFKGSPNLTLPASIIPYANLNDDQKREFLEYKVVIRDLGNLERKAIIDIFERINSTSYSLNAVEIANARYDNDFKKLADELTKLSFWDNHGIFRLNEVKRMQDLNFVLVLLSTLLTDYFNRDDRVEEFLIRYNDGFDESDRIRHSFESALSFIDELQLHPSLRVWQRADLFTLIVEIHRSQFKERETIDQNKVRANLEAFYEAVNNIKSELDSQVKMDLMEPSLQGVVTAQQVRQYYKSTNDATNDRGNRIQRGLIIRHLLKASLK